MSEEEFKPIVDNKTGEKRALKPDEPIYEASKDPKGNGKVVSNTSGEPIIHSFSYDRVDPDDQKVVEEVIRVLKHYHNKQWQIPQIIEQLKFKFKLKDRKWFRVEESLWHNLTKDKNLGASVQGYRICGDTNVPHISFSADADYLDHFIMELANDIKNEVINSQMSDEQFRQNVLKRSKENKE
tara:strand:+ start:20471 stop:21019 length:549 start_codon:yes stop_codon:yes gene_type:complete